nr:MAG TPA: hypothetical protein [Caudoviricetes sp.]
MLSHKNSIYFHLFFRCRLFRVLPYSTHFVHSMAYSI